MICIELTRYIGLIFLMMLCRVMICGHKICSNRGDYLVLKGVYGRCCVERRIDIGEKEDVVFK